jgi:hypothetical protein
MLFFADSTEAGIKDDVVEVNGLVESLSKEAGELRDSHPSAVSSKISCYSCLQNVEHRN